MSNHTSQTDPVARVRDLLGPCVLLAIPLGKKGPNTKEWQKLTLTHMTPEYLASLNGSKNIGVSLGPASQGLCSIDVDNDDELERFLFLNPALQGSLISRGVRGANIWVAFLQPNPFEAGGQFLHFPGCLRGEGESVPVEDEAVFPRQLSLDAVESVHHHCLFAHGSRRAIDSKEPEQRAIKLLVPGVASVGNGRLPGRSCGPYPDKNGNCIAVQPDASNDRGELDSQCGTWKELGMKSVQRAQRPFDLAKPRGPEEQLEFGF